MKKDFSLGEARSPECLLFECISGSRAYGTDTPESDTDLRGVFVLPRDRFFGLGSVEQVSDERHDKTYYEVGRFAQLLQKNNPNILEILFAEDPMIRFRHPLFSLFEKESVLSKLCESTFAGYALTQIRKARGLNKKIVNPMEGPRKSLLEFCHLVEGQGSVPLSDWLRRRDLTQSRCGLVKVPHMRDVFALFYDFTGRLEYRGIVRNPESTEVNLSSVPRNEEPIGWMHCNKDGYKKYCREYREYQDWVANRNDARFAANVANRKNYDAKNLMHTFRLLAMAGEIASEGVVRIARPDREFLLRVRSGVFDYEDLITMAEEKVEAVKAAFSSSTLPEIPAKDRIEESLVKIRERWY